MEWNPVSRRSGEMGVWSSSVLGKRNGGDTAQLAWGGCVCDSSAGTSWPLGEMEVAALKRPPLAFSIHVPTAPSLSGRVPTCPLLPAQVPSQVHLLIMVAFGRKRQMDPDGKTITWCMTSRVDCVAKAALQTRLSTTDAMDRKRARAAADVMGTSEDSPEVRAKRSRVDDLHMAFVLEKGVEKERTQWLGPRKKNKWNAVDPSPFGGVEATMSG